MAHDSGYSARLDILAGRLAAGDDSLHISSDLIAALEQAKEFHRPAWLAVELAIRGPALLELWGGGDATAAQITAWLRRNGSLIARARNVCLDGTQPYDEVARALAEGVPLFVEAALSTAVPVAALAERVRRLDVVSIELIPGVAPDLDLSVPALYSGGPVSTPAPTRASLELALGDDAPRGRGVVVGVVDFGCDFVHPNFRHADGTTRLVALDEVHPGGDINPRFGSARINQWLQSRNPGPYVMHDPHLDANQPYPGYEAQTLGAHGTLVLDAAGGNGAHTLVEGVATAAKLAFMQVGGRATESAASWENVETSAAHAVNRIFDVASSSAAVANLSFSPVCGPRNGTGRFADGLERIVQWQPDAAFGRAIVVSAGNDRGAHRRAAGCLRWWGHGGVAEDFRVALNLPAAANPSPVTAQQVMRIFLTSNLYNDHLRVRLTVPHGWPGAGSTRDLNPHQNDTYPFGNHRLKTTMDANGNLVIRVTERGVRDLAAVAGEGRRIPITLFLDPGAAAATSDMAVEFTAWLDRNPALQAVFDSAVAAKGRTIGVFASSPNVISVGAYYPVTASGTARFYSAEGPSEAAAGGAPPWDRFASAVQRPDVIAPGHGVHAALSYSGPVPRDRSTSEVQRQVTVASGTSLAAAHVSGLVALVFERVGGHGPVGPDYPSHSEVRRALIETAEPVAHQPLDRYGVPAWHPRWGHGRVHAGRLLLHPFPRVASPQPGPTSDLTPIVRVSLLNSVFDPDNASIGACIWRTKNADGSVTQVQEWAGELVRNGRDFEAGAQLSAFGEFVVEANVTTPDRTYTVQPTTFTVTA